MADEQAPNVWLPNSIDPTWFGAANFGDLGVDVATLVGEAGTEGFFGNVMVADVLNNRANSGYWANRFGGTMGQQAQARGGLEFNVWKPGVAGSRERANYDYAGKLRDLIASDAFKNDPNAALATLGHDKALQARDAFMALRAVRGSGDLAGSAGGAHYYSNPTQKWGEGPLKEHTTLGLTEGLNYGRHRFYGQNARDYYTPTAGIYQKDPQLVQEMMIAVRNPYRGWGPSGSSEDTPREHIPPTGGWDQAASQLGHLWNRMDDTSATDPYGVNELMPSFNQGQNPFGRELGLEQRANLIESGVNPDAMSPVFGGNRMTNIDYVTGMGAGFGSLYNETPGNQRYTYDVAANQMAGGDDNPYRGFYSDSASRWAGERAATSFLRGGSPGGYDQLFSDLNFAMRDVFGPEGYTRGLAKPLTDPSFREGADFYELPSDKWMGGQSGWGPSYARLRDAGEQNRFGTSWDALGAWIGPASLWSPERYGPGGYYQPGTPGGYNNPAVGPDPVAGEQNWDYYGPLIGTQSEWSDYPVYGGSGFDKWGGHAAYAKKAQAMYEKTLAQGAADAARRQQEDASLSAIIANSSRASNPQYDPPVNLNIANLNPTNAYDQWAAFQSTQYQPY